MVAFAYALCALIWSTTWFAIRVSLAGYPPSLAAALRFTMAALVLWSLVAAGQGRPLPGRRQVGLLALGGLVNGAGYLLVYQAERHLPGGLMAVLYGTIPLVTALAATAFGLERVRAVQVASALVALVGIALISRGELAVGGGHGTALAAALGGVLASVVYSVLAKRAMAGVHPLAATAVFLSMTMIVSWGAALADGVSPPWPPPPGPTLATIYLALLGSVVAFASYFYLLKHVSLMVANSLVLVQPVLALVVDALFEHQAKPTPATWVGIAITLLGVALGLGAQAHVSRSRRTA